MARIVDWETFFASAAGRTAANWEKGAYARFVSTKQGDRALQAGFAARLNPLAKSPITLRFALTDEVEAVPKDDLRVQVLGLPWAMPLADESCDVVALPHAFDRTPDKMDAILSEVVRVLAPNGLLVTTFFNSIGSWKLREKIFHSSHILPDGAAALSMSAIKAGIVRAGLKIEGGNFGVYAIDHTLKEDWTQASGVQASCFPSWLDKAGDRWWPTLSNVVLLSARKTVAGMTLVGKVNFAAAQAPARVRAAVQNQKHAAKDASQAPATKTQA